MANQTVARRYATAIFELAKEQQAVAPVRAGLHAVRDLFARDAQIRSYFVSPVVNRREKAPVFQRALASLHPIAQHTVLLLVRKRREALFDAIVTEFDELERRDRGATVLTVTTARALPPAELTALTQRLSALYRTNFEPIAVVDPALIGGIRLTIGDRRIDGSISGRLEELAHSLMSTN